MSEVSTPRKEPRWFAIYVRYMWSGLKAEVWFTKAALSVRLILSKITVRARMLLLMEIEDSMVYSKNYRSSQMKKVKDITRYS